MPRRIQVVGELSEEELEARFRASECVIERTHWQMLWLLKGGRASEEVSRLVGLSLNRVRLLVGRYNLHGAPGVADGRRFNAGGSPLLDEQVKAELAALLERPVPEDLGGGLWNGVKVARWLSGRLGQEVHRQRGHEALLSLGFSCQSVRPRHEQANQEKQEAFKKSWHKESKAPAP